ncbi:MAG TPA: ECF-type sigma factor [Candidatus Baltobacteraceae bacterium]|nr:ECF-type sigma factor [Candidatus Baltobacteraceae bacterium]
MNAAAHLAIFRVLNEGKASEHVHDMGCVHGAVNTANSFTGTRRENPFFSAGAEAMRRILIEGAESSRGARAVIASECPSRNAISPPPKADDQLLAVHEAFDKLALEHPLQADLVKLRYLQG